MNSAWEFIGSGTWVNRTLQRRVMLNEDYKRTFCAVKGERYSGYYPGNFFLNASGNVIRFRSREAAMRYAETH